MVDPVTANIGLAVPIRGSDVGTWDTPVNGDFTIIDSMVGGVTSVALTSASVTLATSQAQNRIIRISGTLTASVTINVPAIYTSWTIDNQITNSPSSFAVSLTSTGGAILGCAPGPNDVYYDSTGRLRYTNMGRVGEYWDYAAATVPTWVGLCSKAPWLLCNGGSFSSAAFPILANLLGTTTLPDSRGSPRYALNLGTGRITTAGSGLDGNTIFATKTTQTQTLTTTNLPAYTPTGTINTPNPAFVVELPGNTNSYVAGTVLATGYNTNAYVQLAETFTGNAQGGASTPFGLVATGYVGGITMIRAE